MAAVEFAIIGAPLMLTIVAIFQSALFVYNSSRLDAATHEAARQIMTGSVQKGGLTAAQFRTNLCSQLPVTIPCGSVIVNLQTFPQASFPGGFWAPRKISPYGVMTGVRVRSAVDRSILGLSSKLPDRLNSRDPTRGAPVHPAAAVILSRHTKRRML